jgi:hypothetical protein
MGSRGRGSTERQGSGTRSGTGRFVPAGSGSDAPEYAHSLHSAVERAHRAGSRLWTIPRRSIIGRPGKIEAIEEIVPRSRKSARRRMAAALGDTEERVHHRAQRSLARSAAPARRRKMRLDHRPLFVRRVACVTQPVPPIPRPSDFSPCHVLLRRSSQPRPNHWNLKSLNLFFGQTLRGPIPGGACLPGREAS